MDTSDPNNTSIVTVTEYKKIRFKDICFPFQMKFLVTPNCEIVQ